MKLNPIERVLRGVTLVQARRPVWVLALALGLAAVSILYTFRNLEFQTGQLDLISPDNLLKQNMERLGGFSALDTFIVVIESRDEQRSLQFLHGLVPLLEADPYHYRQVFYRVNPEAFRPWALLYLGPDQLRDLQEGIQEHLSLIRDLARSPDLVRFFRAVNLEMTSAMVGELFTGFLDEPREERPKEPLDLSFLARTLEEMEQWLDGDRSLASPWEPLLMQGQGRSLSEEGYFWTEDRQYLLIFVTPNRKEGFTETLHALAALREKIARLQKEFSDIQAGVTGIEALNQDEMGVAFEDMGVATLISLVGLALLLMLFWRGWRLPLLEMIELSVGLSCTFGLTTLFIGHLNILSITFAPLLLGLSIDYGIHFLARYQEEARQPGVSKEEAVQAVMLKVGPGILLAGVTAALSFFPLVFTGFKGLAELGMITSMGMITSTVTTLCLLPVLTILFGGAVGRRNPAVPAPGARLGFGRSRAWMILVPGGAALALSLWAAPRVSFDLNLLGLQSREAESVVWEKRLLEGSKKSSMAAALLVDSLDAVRPKMEVLEGLPTVSEAQSILSFLPRDQEQKIRILREISPLVAGIEPLSAPDRDIDLSGLDEVLGQIRFKMTERTGSDVRLSEPLQNQMERVRESIDSLRQRFRSMPPGLIGSLEEFERALMRDLGEKLELVRTNARAAPMRISDLPEPLVQRFVSGDGRYLIRIFPAVDIYNRDLLGSFVGEVVAVAPEAAGEPVSWFFFTKAFRDACIGAAVYAVGFILVVLLLTFRDLGTALLVVTPLVIGTAWTFGLMALLDIDLNLANTVFLPLVVGAGVEYGIIIMRRRLEEEGGAETVALPWSTLKGVALAGLTTAVGFGSLTISSHQGIYSLGLLAAVGSLSILAAAVLFLPAILQVTQRGK
jgi:hopanoid biosynthesis associated RND transporter like protein HpnN